MKNSPESIHEVSDLVVGGENEVSKEFVKTEEFSATDSMVTAAGLNGFEGSSCSNLFPAEQWAEVTTKKERESLGQRDKVRKKGSCRVVSENLIDLVQRITHGVEKGMFN
ncbi:hypothetical protein L3X38_032031 [Prunus dulcis]|uniref:Uncharacterized protein n=1 Tax=Prunus dulcis TaxID=3755 RepID=A0AAD4YVN0_PRUDU|nr:hypothetical protein L3X38_032031 [Prunus dulcis]